jgi:hypothetical protein
VEKVVDARKHVGISFPTEEGARLADSLLQLESDWSQLSIDLRTMPAGLLISAFFNGFLQRVHEKKPELLPTARIVKWQLAHPFQEKNVREWMRDFQPQGPA